MSLRSYQWCELLGVALILLSTGAQIFWVQPYEKDVETRERFAINSMASGERRFYWSVLNQSILTNQILMLKELNSNSYEERKSKLDPILNSKIEYSDNDNRAAYESGNITPDIMKSELWQSIKEENPFTKTMRYWIFVQKERLDIATYVTFGFFLLGSALTGIGRAIEMRRANARQALNQD
jgi:hypothetical protein